MNTLEKFYSDALKLVQKSEPEVGKETLPDFFCRTIRTYDKALLPVAEDIAQYWIETHNGEDGNTAAQWFYEVFSLLDNTFTDDMDFNNADWEAFQSIITAYSESLSLDFLQSFMSIVIERHKMG